MQGSFTPTFDAEYYIRQKPLAVGRYVGQGSCLIPTALQINAGRFHGELGQCLGAYHCALQQARFDSPLWTALKIKMETICENS